MKYIFISKTLKYILNKSIITNVQIVRTKKAREWKKEP